MLGKKYLKKTCHGNLMRKNEQEYNSMAQPISVERLVCARAKHIELLLQKEGILIIL
jgi:hypothetical protein